MALDQPAALRAEHAVFRRRGDALVHQRVVKRQPDLAAPGARADYLAQPQALEALRERLAVRRRELVADDDDVAAKGVLHVPCRVLADTLVPVEPRLTQQPADDPAINVAAL